MLSLFLRRTLRLLDMGPKKTIFRYFCITSEPLRCNQQCIENLESVKAFPFCLVWIYFLFFTSRHSHILPINTSRFSFLCSNNKKENIIVIVRSFIHAPASELRTIFNILSYYIFNIDCFGF